MVRNWIAGRYKRQYQTRPKELSTFSELWVLGPGVWTWHTWRSTFIFPYIGFVGVGNLTVNSKPKPQIVTRIVIVQCLMEKDDTRLHIFFLLSVRVYIRIYTYTNSLLTVSIVIFISRMSGVKTAISYLHFHCELKYPRLLYLHARTHYSYYRLHSRWGYACTNCRYCERGCHGWTGQYWDIRKCLWWCAVFVSDDAQMRPLLGDPRVAAESGGGGGRKSCKLFVCGWYYWATSALARWAGISKKRMHISSSPCFL